MEQLAKNLFYLGIAGAVGTLCRYGLELGLSRYLGRQFPWGIVAINLLGCFAFGWVWSFTSKRMLDHTPFKLILLVGFMGAFTTFSTYAFQTLQLLGAGRLWWGAAYFGISNLGGFAMISLGMAIGSR